jgi:hypothetical protein
MLLFILVSLISAGIPDEFACIAGPQIYGPECKASLATEGSSGIMIIYEITEIISSTNIECLGLAINNTVDCNNKVLDWYPLGVFSDNGRSTLFWGDNIGYPAIKCKGLPIPTSIKWKYSLTYDNYVGCCGNVKYNYDPDKTCCGNKIYKNDNVNGCCGEVWTNSLNCCAIVDSDSGRGYDIPCPMANCCQKDITTFETVCCDHACFNTQCYKPANFLE